MTTPASPAPASPGGGTPAPSPTGSQTRRPPADPGNVLAQGQQAQAGQAQARGGREGLSPDEERQLGELLEKRDRGSGPAPVRLRVTSDHESVTYGGFTLGREFTEVPAHLVAGLTEGAAGAGVEIEQDQES